MCVLSTQLGYSMLDLNGHYPSKYLQQVSKFNMSGALRKPDCDASSGFRGRAEFGHSRNCSLTKRNTQLELLHENMDAWAQEP